MKKVLSATFLSLFITGPLAAHENDYVCVITCSELGHTITVSHSDSDLDEAWADAIGECQTKLDTLYPEVTNLYGETMADFEEDSVSWEGALQAFKTRSYDEVAHH